VANVTQDEVLGMIIAGICPPAAIPGPGAMAAARGDASTAFEAQK